MTLPDLTRKKAFEGRRRQDSIGQDNRGCWMNVVTRDEISKFIESNECCRGHVMVNAERINAAEV